MAPPTDELCRVHPGNIPDGQESCCIYPLIPNTSGKELCWGHCIAGAWGPPCAPADGALRRRCGLTRAAGSCLCGQGLPWPPQVSWEVGQARMGTQPHPLYHLPSRPRPRDQFPFKRTDRDHTMCSPDTTSRAHGKTTCHRLPSS